MILLAPCHDNLTSCSESDCIMKFGRGKLLLDLALTSKPHSKKEREREREREREFRGALWIPKKLVRMYQQISLDFYRILKPQQQSAKF